MNNEYIQVIDSLIGAVANNRRELAAIEDRLIDLLAKQLAVDEANAESELEAALTDEMLATVLSAAETSVESDRTPRTAIGRTLLSVANVVNRAAVML